MYKYLLCTLSNRLHARKITTFVIQSYENIYWSICSTEVIPYRFVPLVANLLYVIVMPGNFHFEDSYELIALHLLKSY